MPLVLEEPPDDGLAVLKQGLQQAHTRKLSILRGANPPVGAPPAPVVMAPHPIYAIAVDALLTGKGIEAATLVGWRYLLVEGTTVEKAAEIRISRGTAVAFYGINSGPAVTSAATALAAAEQLPQVQRRDFDIRFLRIPSLGVKALWLHGQGRHDDQFLLLSSLTQTNDSGAVLARFEAQKPYPADQLFPALAAIAREKVRLHDALPHP